MTANCMNSIGLVLDIIGVIILFFYGLPSKVNFNGKVILTTNSITAEKEKFDRYLKMSRFGLGLIILGFVFQLISNFL